MNDAPHRPDPHSPRGEHAENQRRGEERKERQAKRKKAMDDALDRGLQDSFPGSDPVAVTQPPPSARDKNKP
jgi:hypothetical protein